MGIFDTAIYRAFPCKPLKLRKFTCSIFVRGFLLMARIFCRDRVCGSFGSLRWVLAAVFAFGFCCGLAFGFHFGGDIASLMPGSFLGSVSIVQVLIHLLLPFAVSGLLCLFSPFLLIPVCFCRAFVFSFTHFCVLMAWGWSGWLVRWLLLFSDCLCLPLLYCFWLRCLSGTGAKTSQTGAILLFAGAVGIFDCVFVLPYGAGLLFLQKG